MTQSRDPDFVVNLTRDKSTTRSNRQPALYEFFGASKATTWNPIDFRFDNLNSKISVGAEIPRFLQDPTEIIPRISESCITKAFQAHDEPIPISPRYSTYCLSPH